jgi:hypothetical protein
MDMAAASATEPAAPTPDHARDNASAASVSIEALGSGIVLLPRMAVRPDTDTAGALAMRAARLLKVARVKLLCPDATELGPPDALLRDCAGFETGMALQRFVCPAWTGALEAPEGYTHKSPAHVSTDGALIVGVTYDANRPWIVCWSSRTGKAVWSHDAKTGWPGAEGAVRDLCLWKGFVVATCHWKGVVSVTCNGDDVCSSLCVWDVSTGKLVGFMPDDNVRVHVLVPTRDVLFCMATPATQEEVRRHSDVCRIMTLQIRPRGGVGVVLRPTDPDIRTYDSHFRSRVSAVEPNGLFFRSAHGQHRSIMRINTDGRAVTLPCTFDFTQTLRAHKQVKLSRSGRFYAWTQNISDARATVNVFCRDTHAEARCDVSVSPLSRVFWGANDDLFVVVDDWTTAPAEKWLRRLTCTGLGGPEFTWSKEKWTLCDLHRRCSKNNMSDDEAAPQNGSSVILVVDADRIVLQINGRRLLVRLD